MFSFHTSAIFNKFFSQGGAVIPSGVPVQRDADKESKVGKGFVLMALLVKEIVSGPLLIPG